MLFLRRNIPLKLRPCLILLLFLIRIKAGLKPGEKRFVMSLRATGEGHISSIVFHTGTVDAAGNIILDNLPDIYDCLQKNRDAIYEKNFIRNHAGFIPGFETAILDKLPDSFTAEAGNKYFNVIAGIDETMVYSVEYSKRLWI